MAKYDVKVKKLPKSEAEIEVVIPAEVLDKSRSKALQALNNSLDIKGFRKGKIPDEIILETVGLGRVLEDSAEIAINESFAEIMGEAEVDAIGRPKVSILKLAFGNPLTIKIITSVLPEFSLPDYRAIARSSVALAESDSEVAATEKEIEDVVMQVRKNKAHSDWHHKNPDEKSHDKHPNFEDESNLPIFDDEFAKSVSGLSGVEELKAKIKENIISDKKIKNIEKRRAEIMEKLVEETKIDLPILLVDSEVEKSIAQIKDDMKRIGGNFEDYLKHINKTEEDLRKEMEPSAEKRAKIQLILNKIAEVEKLEPNQTILDAEVKKILELYPEAKEDSARIYVATELLNGEVLKLLESA